MVFNYETVRGLQKQCVGSPIRDVDYLQDDARLKEAKELLELHRSDEAIAILNGVIENGGAEPQPVPIVGTPQDGNHSRCVDATLEQWTAMKDSLDQMAAAKTEKTEERQGHKAVVLESKQSTSGAIPKKKSGEETSAAHTVDPTLSQEASPRASMVILAKAHLLSAEAFLKANLLVKARNKAQEAILVAPNLMPAYSLLSDVEKNRGQFGRAELALVLGLKIDKQNDGLAVQLQTFRTEKDPKLLPQTKLEEEPENLDKRDMASLIDNQRKKFEDTGKFNNDDLLSPDVRSIKDLGRQQNVELHFVDRLPLIVRSIIVGDLPMIERIWNPSMIDNRETCLDTPLMQFPVIGATKRQLESSVSPDLTAYKAIIDFLFDRGVRLDARDKRGYTALFAAASHVRNCELLLHLLRKGADPNVKTIFGTVALRLAVVTQNIEAVDILLAHGADPNIEDNCGETTYFTATQFKEIHAVFDKYFQLKIPERVCHACNGKGLKRCSQCRVVFYCSGDCQKTHWCSHKKACKKLVKGHKRLAVAKPDNKGDEYMLVPAQYEAHAKSVFNMQVPEHLRRKGPKLSMEILDHNRLFSVYENEFREKGNLLLKISGAREMMKKEMVPDQGFIAYNKDHSFMCWLDRNALDAEDFKKVLVERGGKNFKAYFWAFMEKGKNEITVITEPRLPAQPW